VKSLVIRSHAPTRIDLAGGTVDLWPLYLFLKNPVTMNVAIDLYAEAELRTTSGNEIVLKTIDQGTESRHTWEELLSDQESEGIAPGLQLHYKLLRYFARWRVESGQPLSSWNNGLVLSTQAKSPAGAGLGGSSTLSVALVGALANWAKWGNGEASQNGIDPIRDGEQLVEIVRDVETTVIQVPAGVQDYYGAMFGGLQSLRWNAGSHKREWLPDSALAGLEDRLLLFYSGQSRNSGINNWALFKAFIDGESSVRSKFGRIAEAAGRLDAALRKQDWELSADAIADEWSVRRTLAPGISTPEIDRAFQSASSAAKSERIAGKVCGAGGGGCVFMFVPSGNEELKNKVRDAFLAEGMRQLPLKTCAKGLEVQVSRA